MAAKRLLIQSGMPVSAVAEAVGISDGLDHALQPDIGRQGLQRLGVGPQLLPGVLPELEEGPVKLLHVYNYFSKVFRSVAGVTPSQFRKNARPAAGPPLPDR